MSAWESIVEVRDLVIRALEHNDEILGEAITTDEFELGADLRDCLRPALRVIEVHMKAEWNKVPL